MEGKKPDKKFRVGGVVAAVWTNSIEHDGKEDEFKVVSLEKNYKDMDGNWRKTSTFIESDVARAILALNKAYEYISVSTDD